ncbi:hypothetical protein SCO85_12060 [Legionella pneumophila serogroup 1]|uniref:hypothetical protein n=1 Tax=Legionella pneumophila TaxID=446 RepID=UPI001A1A6FCF|nr:hypothetical protein [Legionella pneumophila]MCH9108509.1 hypothetical protein [Legionella pneumophila serogroup 1]MCH9115257.1 hypothetical protein [Legionella pneumophila serogroup 1]MDW8895610.1 hypothetical protein [Legionella pneumophila]MDW9033736.1 hypothetical protein [Legionella pneumophila]MDW9048722.1 hypothetical protein [Legionella pneumophila]
MVDNINRMYVFVKGYKGQAAFLLADINFNEIHKDIIESLDVNDQPYSALHSDYKAVIESLKYIRDHRGQSSIPKSPVIFIFTNTENNYEISISTKKPRKPEVEAFKAEIGQLVRELHRSTYDNNVKFIYIPKNFQYLMPSLIDFLDNSRSSDKKIKP